MKIVYVTRWFSKNMGYIENCLPYALSQMGHEVHIISSTAQVYYNAPFYQKTYQSFLGDPILNAGTEIDKNVFIHRLPFIKFKEQFYIKGLINKIRSIDPEIVQVFEHNCIDTYRIALWKVLAKFRLFTGNHYVLSVFPLAKSWKNLSLVKKLRWNLLFRYPGKFVSYCSEKCYAVTEDAGYIATRFLGVSANKVVVSTLGVDTDTFYPFNDLKEKNLAKVSLGFSESDIICIYTGRFTAEKNPLIAARAIGELVNKGFPVKGLFIGEGEQKQEIRELPYCKVVDFIPYPALPVYYRIADIGIWPSQESTSQLDAVASGVNVILTDNIKAYAEIENNDAAITRPKIVSRFYKNQDLTNLKSVLLSLTDASQRQRLAEKGVEEIRKKYSWVKIAESRISDYQASR